MTAQILRVKILKAKLQFQMSRIIEIRKLWYQVRNQATVKAIQAAVILMVIQNHLALTAIIVIILKKRIKSSKLYIIVDGSFYIVKINVILYINYIFRKKGNNPKKIFKPKSEFDDLPPIEDLKISVPEVLCDPLGEVISLF